MNGSVSMDRRPIVEQCDGCERIVNQDGGKFCGPFAFPDSKWRLGPCSMATHVKLDTAQTGEKRRVGQQKQKKK